MHIDIQRRSMLRSACLLMIATGAAFALSSEYWPLVIVAFVGTINPTAGDVSLFLPARADRAGAIGVGGRPNGVVCALQPRRHAVRAELGVLMASIPEWLAQHLEHQPPRSQRS